MPKSKPLTTPSITVAEAADILRVNRKTVLRRMAAGLLKPTQKLPGETGAYLFDRAEVERLAVERRAS